jgi:hypothetical protein
MSTKTRVESTAFSDNGFEYVVLCVAAFELQRDVWRLTKIHVTRFSDPPVSAYIEDDAQPFNAPFDSPSTALRAGFERALHDVRTGVWRPAK